MAARGLLIFPLSPGSKVPYGKESWPAIMTRNPETIRGWFETRADMNYGCCPGKSFVIIDPDVDVKKGKDGLALFKEIELEFWEEPVIGCTFEVTSPRGGRHLYLSTEIAVTSNAKGLFGQGIDIRGFGGYVVGPGSHTVDDGKTTATGTYEIVNDCPIMAAPSWVMARVTPAMERSKDAFVPTTDWDLPVQVDKAKAIILKQTEWPQWDKNSDNETMDMIRFACRDNTVSPETALTLLTTDIYTDDAHDSDGVKRRSWASRCSDGKGGYAAFDADWIEQKITNAYKYSKKQPGATTGALMDSMPEYGAEQTAQAIAAETDAKLSKLDEITFTGTSLLRRDVRREFIIPELLIADPGSVHLLLALRGTGKTIFMADMMCRIAVDDAWHSKPIKPGFTSVYACGEDDIGFQENFAAWVKKHNKHPEDDRLIIMTNVPDLCDTEAVLAWTLHLQKRLNGRRPVIFIDTWQRATGSGGQSDDKDMSGAFKNLEQMCKILKGCCIVSCHPPKHNLDTVMGSTIVENQSAAIWQMKKESNGRTRCVTVTRIKGRGQDKYYLFEADDVGLGVMDDFGDERKGFVSKMVGDNTGTTPEYAIQVKSARMAYASVIAHLIAEWQGEGPKRDGKAFSSLLNTAERVKAFLATKEGQAFETELKRIGDTSYNREAKGLSEHLKKQFVDIRGPQEANTGLYVSAVKTNKGFGFIIDDEAKKRADKAALELEQMGL